MDEARERAAHFLDKTKIKGKDSSGGPITTNLTYLKNNLGRLLAF